jgi:hypothetical protein
LQLIDGILQCGKYLLLGGESQLKRWDEIIFVSLDFGEVGICLLLSFDLVLFDIFCDLLLSI